MFGTEHITVIKFTKHFPAGSIEDAMKDLLKKATAKRASIPAEVPEVTSPTIRYNLASWYVTWHLPLPDFGDFLA